MQGRVGFALTEGNLAGGAGAEAFLVGSASLQDYASADLPSATVRAASDSFGHHVAHVVLHTPTGDVEWLHQPSDPEDGERHDNFALAEGGPGTYGVTVDRGGAVIQPFWVAVWGLDGHFDLTQGQSSVSVIKS